MHIAPPRRIPYMHFHQYFVKGSRGRSRNRQVYYLSLLNGLALSLSFARFARAWHPGHFAAGRQMVTTTPAASLFRCEPHIELASSASEFFWYFRNSHVAVPAPVKITFIS